MTPVVRNIVRTAVPAVVGAVASFITKVTAHLTPAETATLFPIVTTAYYSVIRVLEAKYPKLSWLLGALPQAKAPSVSSPAAPTVQATAEAVATATPAASTQTPQA